MSTFIVECDAATWYRAGLDRMSDEESRAYCEQVFAPDLDGQPLHLQPFHLAQLPADLHPQLGG